MSIHAANVIAHRLTAEIVGPTNSYNGGRLTGDQANGLAHLIVGTLQNAGYAIVELPEPDCFNHWDIPACGEFNGMESTGDSVVAVDITSEGIEPEAFGDMTPLETRLFAAALLAAADVAEQISA